MLNKNVGFELNSKGYLVNFDAWDEGFAIKLAKENGWDLTGYHWLIINFLRNHQSEYGIAPDHREIIKKLGKQINPTGPCTREHLEDLFGQGGCELACKMAGLPNGHCRGA
ncbi:MAG: TusE/DsrC/DsvC family sulfur relay protein [Gammaproteobacteria bacterium]|nr:TusE/DsrC/DsvC family sulfur relay protein [Gammaproteobacteria bacterium]